MRLQGKHILITAAGQGIGKATVLAMVAEGATVWATDVNPVLLEAFKGMDHVHTAVLDVMDKAAIQAQMAAMDRIDALFNCAGYVHSGTALTATDEDWNLAFNLNVRSQFWAIQAALPKMIAQGGGSIINMASVASSVKGLPNRFVYGASKAAVIGLTKAVAADHVRQGIRCNAICPGWVDTPINHAHAKMLGGLDHVYKTIDSFQPIGRPGTSREIANVVLFLASDESSFMTGSIVSADGGMTAQ